MANKNQNPRLKLKKMDFQSNSLNFVSNISMKNKKRQFTKKTKIKIKS